MKLEEKVFREQMQGWLRICMIAEVARVQTYRDNSADQRNLKRGKEAAEVLESLARTYTMFSRRGKP